MPKDATWVYFVNTEMILKKILHLIFLAFSKAKKRRRNKAKVQRCHCKGKSTFSCRKVEGRSRGQKGSQTGRGSYTRKTKGD